MKYIILLPFEELQGLNMELKLITSKLITLTDFGTMEIIFDIFKRLYLSCVKSYKAEFFNQAKYPQIYKWELI